MSIDPTIDILIDKILKEKTTHVMSLGHPKRNETYSSKDQTNMPMI